MQKNIFKKSTEHFTFVYTERNEEPVAELLFFCEEVYNEVTNYFGVYPQHVNVMISNELDIANGYFSPIPLHINLFEHRKSLFLVPGLKTGSKYC